MLAGVGPCPAGVTSVDGGVLAAAVSGCGESGMVGGALLDCLRGTDCGDGAVGAGVGCGREFCPGATVGLVDGPDCGLMTGITP